MNTKFLDSYSVPCDAEQGFAGSGIMTCTGQDEWTLVGCKLGCPASAVPASAPAGYGALPSVAAITEANHKYPMTCLTGYKVTEPALACGDGDKVFTISGCDVIQCDANTGTAGTAGACTCAAGYEGTVTYVDGAAVGCSACASGSWSTAGGSCAPIACTEGYTGAAGACTCASGFYGSVLFVEGVPTGCVGKACEGTAYTGSAGLCTCAGGHEGTVVFPSSSSGALSGCSACPSATSSWAEPGNGNTCATIACTSTGYTGSSSACTCATGYSGTVTYTQGQLGGCVAVECSGAGVTGTAGACTCDAGYEGSVTYSGATASGCTQCASGKWSAAGDASCSAIACDATGYSGIAGACTCNTAAYYSGSVTYTDGALGGCVLTECGDTNSLANFAQWIQQGVGAAAGVDLSAFDVDWGIVAQMYVADVYVIASGASSVTSTRSVTCKSGFSGNPPPIKCQSSGKWDLVFDNLQSLSICVEDSQANMEYDGAATNAVSVGVIAATVATLFLA